jgi:outer membrane lipoprotein SlyB
VAQLVLTIVGGALGGSVGGGLGQSLGSLLGAVAGGLIDQELFGPQRERRTPETG